MPEQNHQSIKNGPYLNVAVEMKIRNGLVISEEAQVFPVTE